MKFSSNVEARQSVVDECYKAIFGAKETASVEPATLLVTPTGLTDAEIIERASNANNGAKFRALYFDGNLDGYATPSEADLALCSLLRFWSGDRETVRRLFGQSKLGKRDKWERADYQERTLNKAWKGDVFSPRGKAAGTDILVLPSGSVTITEAATNLFQRIAPTHTLFYRGGVVVMLVQAQQGGLALEVVGPPAARSLFEKYAQFMVWRAGKGEDGKAVLKPTTIPEEMARAFLESEVARQLLPRVDGLINCPVIVGDGEIVGPGYHEGTRQLITDGELPPEVPLSMAVESLKELVSEYDFQTPGDRSRALASSIAPALKLGGHLKGNVPADVAEADKSQSGKTYRQKTVAAVYNEKASLVTCRAGGVGSVDESLNQQLIAGRPFIQLDNFRGKFDSPHIEALLTAEKSFPARVPHWREVMIDPSRFFVMLTSNGVETTRDFANRSNIIRIKKREGFTFRRYPEGDLLAHIRARQPFYLGCVFAVVRAWIAQGRQRTNETRHDFREWCQTLDWIVQNILGEAPLMDGHEAAQERVSNSALTFLRKLALAVADQRRLGEKLNASQLYELAEAAGVDVPGLREPDEEHGKRQIGSIMARVFKTGDRVVVDAFEVLGVAGTLVSQWLAGKLKLQGQ